VTSGLLACSHTNASDHKLVGYLPGLDGLNLVDVIAEVTACVLGEALEI